MLPDIPVLPLVVLSKEPEPAGDTDTITRALAAVRSHLGMDIAYVSEFVGDRSVFRNVDAPGHQDIVKAGDSVCLDDVYCKHILEGRLPELIPDTRIEPLAMSLPVTNTLPIGSHMSVPIKLPDGSVYGMFCCLGFQPDASLNDRDLKMLRAFADITAIQIGRDREESDRQRRAADRIRAVLADEGAFSVVYQPIVRLRDNLVVGFECLSRFSGSQARAPDLWFADAADAGLGVELEVEAIRKALRNFERFGADAFLSVNASPTTVISGALITVFEGIPLSRIVLELTEHAVVEDYTAVQTALADLRARGLRIAIDDAGAGYAGLRHILDLAPDFIKLDISITRNIDTDPARRALAAALITFSQQTGCRIVAEGVETAGELNTLRGLGIDKVQGYLLSRPVPVEQAIELAGKPFAAAAASAA